MADLKLIINGVPTLANDAQRIEVKEALGLYHTAYDLSVSNNVLSLPASPRIGERWSASVHAVSGGYTVKVIPEIGQRIYVGDLVGALGDVSSNGFLQSPSHIGAYIELIYVAANKWVVTNGTGIWSLDQ